MAEIAFDLNLVYIILVVAAILLKHYGAVINREMYLYLKDKNVDIKPIEETRVLRFHRMICNSLGEFKSEIW